MIKNYKQAYVPDSTWPIAIYCCRCDTFSYLIDTAFYLGEYCLSDPDSHNSFCKHCKSVRVTLFRLDISMTRI